MSILDDILSEARRRRNPARTRHPAAGEGDRKKLTAFIAQIIEAGFKPKKKGKADLFYHEDFPNITVRVISSGYKIMKGSRRVLTDSIKKLFSFMAQIDSEHDS